MIYNPSITLLLRLLPEHFEVTKSASFVFFFLHHTGYTDKPLIISKYSQLFFISMVAAAMSKVTYQIPAINEDFTAHSNIDINIVWQYRPHENKIIYDICLMCCLLGFT